MPYAFELHHVRLPRSLDRRIKLTNEERASIRDLHRHGLATRAIARMFPKVSRRLIVFVIHPDRLAHNAAVRKERAKDGRYYHGGSKWAATIREHRRYKSKALSIQREKQ